MYDGAHSIIFGEKHTWDDWKLMPISRPLFNPPPLKSKYIDLPGGNGSIDLSESLTGYPVYENRTGSFDFVVVNDYGKWEERYEEIINYIHGRKMQAILEDDPEYFYEGRFTVNKWDSKNDGTWSEITIDYNVDPYKWSVKNSLDPWEWDPFNFETGYITSSIYQNIPVTSSSWKQVDIPSAFLGNAPISPTLIISTSNSNGMDVKFKNTSLGIDLDTAHYPDGTNKTYDYILYGTGISFYFKGNGTVSISFRRGKL